MHSAILVFDGACKDRAVQRISQSDSGLEKEETAGWISDCCVLYRFGENTVEKKSSGGAHVSAICVLKYVMIYP